MSSVNNLLIRQRANLNMHIQTLFYNVLNYDTSVLGHCRPVLCSLTYLLFNIMLNINVMTSETVNRKKDPSLCWNQEL